MNPAFGVRDGHNVVHYWVVNKRVYAFCGLLAALADPRLRIEDSTSWEREDLIDAPITCLMCLGSTS